MNNSQKAVTMAQNVRITAGRELARNIFRTGYDFCDFRGLAALIGVTKGMVSMVGDEWEQYGRLKAAADYVYSMRHSGSTYSNDFMYLATVLGLWEAEDEDNSYKR